MKNYFMQTTGLILALMIPSTVFASGPIATIPEPSVWSLLGMGAVAGIIVSRLKKNK